MNIQLNEIKVREIFSEYENNNEEGVVGYAGKLNIRPAYQREFIYLDKQRDAVIDTVRKNFPLNVMYWIKSGSDSFEVLDGQQRTISVCEYIKGSFAIDSMYYKNLTQEEKDQILDYKFMIYICEGTDREKLDWFKIINIAGAKLTDQELRNAIYTGTWLTDAKRYFSKSNSPAKDLASDYLSGVAIRQEYLETVISWISSGQIEEYMAKNQNKANANELWLYFNSLIEWIKATFPVYRREMKGLNYGPLYADFKDAELDTTALENEISTLMMDDEVSKKSGIYYYVLTGDEKYLNLRAFTESQRRKCFEVQKGKCPVCKKKFSFEEMHADHITPWHLGGKTSIENCQMLCAADNRTKSGK